MKVLGLKARDFATIAASAKRVVAYLEGTRKQTRTAGGYYTGGHQGPGGPVATGWARGSISYLVGLDGHVEADQLERLLTGRHAVTGAALLTARGSAGRSQANHAQIQALLSDAPDVLTLAQAAQFAAVSPTYLRRLAEDYEVGKMTGARAAQTAAEVRESHDSLRAFRDLSGRRWLVTRQELARFMDARRPPTVVMGYDLTCSAPKSVSLLWAFGDSALRHDVSAALDAGVEAALRYLELNAVVGTLDGRNRPGLGLAAASYQHEISRSEEAHLHWHTILINAVPIPMIDDDGRPVLDNHGVAKVVWRALDGEVLLRHVKTAGYVGATVLRHELARRRGVSWGPVRNGVAEITGFPSELLEAFSTRHGELTAEFTQLVEEGFPSDAATLAAAQRGTRTAKRVLSDPQVEAIQAAKLTEAGWNVEQVRALATPRPQRPAPPSPEQVTALFDDLTGPNGLTEQQPTFGHREVTQAIAAWARDRLDADAIALLVQEFLADPRIALLARQRHRRRNQDEDTYTTIDLLQVEDCLIRLYRQGRTDHGGPPRTRINTELIDTAIRAVDQRLRQEHPHEDRASKEMGLSDEQADIARALLESGDLIRAVVGPAGTGKTEAMRILVHAFTAAGHRVLATANGGRQTQDLAERLNIPAQVVAGWLTLLDDTADPATVWKPGTVLIVDEATQVSTRDGERLVRYATRTGAVMILVGDPAQLGSVGAGGWFRHLVTITPDIAGLSINQRQRGQSMHEVRKALAGLRQHTPAADQDALRRLAADGRITVFDNREDMLAAIVTDWYTERHTGPPGERSRMMAEHHRDTDLLNRAARERLTADGTLTGPILRVSGRDFQAGDEVITLTQAGHTLLPAERPRREYIRTGTIGTITTLHIDPDHPDHQHLTVAFSGRGEVHVDWAYLTHAFSDGRDGGLAHAYAQTGHKAEGSTMHSSRAAVTDDTSRAGLYVMLSRPRNDLRAYLIRRADLHADLDDEDWLPILQTSTGPIRAVLDHLAETGPERLAGELDPIAQAAHELTTTHSLAELTTLRRRQSANLRTAIAHGTNTTSAERKLLITRRAEIAAETTTAHAARAHPAPRLQARIGARPTSGSDASTWDRAVTAMAVFHARYGPARAPDELPSHPPAIDPESEQEWLSLRDRAEHVTDAWAQALDLKRRKRFYSRQETIPRQKSLVAVHALLAHGWSEQRISTALTAEPLEGIRTAAAVLEYRTQALLETAGVDPAYYNLPPAAPAARDWEQTKSLMQSAAVHYLATRATGDLSAEHRDLTSFLTSTPRERLWETRKRRDIDRLTRTKMVAAAVRLHDAEHLLGNARVRAASSRTVLEGLQHDADHARHDLACHQITAELTRTWAVATGSDPATSDEKVSDAMSELRSRLRLVDAALAHQIDLAAVRLAQEPAAYLTGLLGDRSTNPAAATAWNRRAVAVEHYRHHALGLPYAHPAAPATAAASEQALGPRPTDPATLARYERARGIQPTLDLGAVL